MKKLFALLVMLGGALSSWAYGGHEGQTVNGIIFSEIGPAEGDPTQIITFTAEGTGNLAAWWDNLGNPEKNQFTEGNNPDKKLVVSGPMSAADFAVISGWNKFISADFSGVTVSQKSDVEGMILGNATNIILPPACTDYAVANSTQWPNANIVVANGGQDIAIYTKEGGNLVAAVELLGDITNAKNATMAGVYNSNDMVHINGKISNWGDSTDPNNINGCFCDLNLIDFSDASVSLNDLILIGEEGNKIISTYVNPWYTDVKLQTVELTQMIVWPKSVQPTLAQIASVQAKQNGQLKFNSFAYYTDNTGKELHTTVWQNSSKECNDDEIDLLATMYENKGVKSLVFDPQYNADGTVKSYDNVNATDFFDALSDVPAENIDFSGCNISSLGKDYSNLNNATLYITIPINNETADYDFTNEDVWNYNDNLRVVTTYKDPNGTDTYFLHGQSHVVTQTTNITYVRTPGSLTGTVPYSNQKILGAETQIFAGNLNDVDLSVMEELEATTFDFVDASISPREDMVKFRNANVLYLALPASAANTIAGKETSCDYSPNCPYLLCVGALNTETHKYTTWSKQNLNNGVQVPSVYQISLMYPASEISAITDVDMSGYLCRKDITVGVDDAVENKSEIAAVIGLSNANAIVTADFGDAVFMPNSDMRFVGIYSEGRAGWSGNALTSITFPTSESQEEIPSYCLVGGSNSQEMVIHIPSNYKTIGDYAFHLRKATKITTTKKEIDSNGDVVEKIVDNGDYTISLPASLESIGTGAFVLHHELITDVYVLAKTAPTCAPDAFNTGAYCGYGGFAGNYAHPISRDTYINNGTKFAILHFPSDVEENEAKKYTDITREYSLMDETGAYDGEGKLKAWPNFSEIYRAYHQAVDGAIWKTDGWDTTRGTGWTTDEQGNTISNGRNFNDIASWPATYLDANGNPVTVKNLYDASKMMSSATVTPGDAYDTRYMGWHQFVLADYYRYTTPTPPADDANYVDAGWYTLCIPYDLTEAQVINLIGAPASGTYEGNAPSKNSAGDHFPVVYALKTVTRQDPTVTLGFSQELMGTIYNGQDLKFNDNGTISIENYNYDAPSGKTEKIYIKGGYSYLVRPIVPEGTTIGNNLGQWMLKNSSFTESELGNRLELGNDNSVAIPIQKHKVIATDSEGNQLTYFDDNNEEQPYYYYFQGTYTTEKMPTAYFLTDRWYRQTEPDVRNWDNYTAIIAGKSTANGATPVTKTPAEFTAAKDLTTYFIKMVCGRDHFHWKGGNVKIKVTFEDENGFDQALAIDQIDGKDLNTVTEGTVYNMAGQKVGSSLNGLAKGLYIVNGKKVMVK